MSAFPRASQYTDLQAIYAQCSGPGGLRLAEYVADKLALAPDMRVLDVGVNRGLQTCFLAKEYGCFVVGVDPWPDNFSPEGDGRPFVAHLADHAERWGVSDRVLGVQIGVPDLKFADASFDAAYSTTALEMIRGLEGEEQYRACLAEVGRVLRPGALFGLAEPMHLPGDPPPDLAPLVDDGFLPFRKCLATPEETAESFRQAGFEVLDFGYAPDAAEWWAEFVRYDLECQKNPDGNPRMLSVDGGRWISFGFVLARWP